MREGQPGSASIALFPESPQHLGEDKRKILWYNRRYRLKRRCRKEASIESRPRIALSEEGRGIIDATDENGVAVKLCPLAPVGWMGRTETGEF